MIKKRQGSSRHVGIELARILAMLMICNLHILGIGGILDKLGHSWNGYYVFANVLESFSYAAVNIYILISGYVGLTSRFSYRKFGRLWLQVIFYTLSITALFSIVSKQGITLQDWSNAVFPIVHNQYWFMTCYFGLLLFAPFINQAVQVLPKKQLGQLVVGSFLLFSLLPTLFKQDIFGLTEGYSVLWLLVMYLFGAAVRRFELEKDIRFWQCFLGLIVMVGLTFSLNWFSYVQWRSYISPTVVFQSLFFFLICLKIKELPPLWSRIVLTISPLTLGVYLTHVHPLVFTRILPKLADVIVPHKLFIFMFLIVLLTFIIFILGIFVDYFRAKLFHYFQKRLSGQ
ncbi:acyltransferase [Streptococcus dentiloxodontae]